jgi:hypothetical protein
MEKIQNKKYFTEAEARDKICPFMSTPLDKIRCYASNCIAWQVAFGRVEREDHSDGHLHISEYGSKTGRRARREGPGGSMGHWILDEIGYCERLQNKEEGI